jgi:hypothetical protein
VPPAVSDGRTQVPLTQSEEFFSPAATTDQVAEGLATDRHSSAHTKSSKVVLDQRTSIVVALRS